ncbi:MAG: glycosyltransferase family 4 protein [Candidatus Omnitrophica bacterium]|nr:glycosyltransferase family 4 protein [Candidatus Omnitrophota bacterium]MCM8791338.1 glycosyltransferase family 4 protein [Candidatus Omnitrophota bacterium]
MVDKRKVLLIGPVAPPVGGMTISMENIVTSKLRESYTFYVLDVTGCKTRDKKASILKRMFHQIRLFWRLFYILMRKNPALIHVQMSSFQYFYRRGIDIVVSRLFRKKIILHLRGGSFVEFYEEAPYIAKWAIRVVLGMSNRIIALSSYWKEVLVTMSEPAKISVIPNGVKVSELRLKENIRPRLGLSATDIVILHVGPIGRRKGSFDLVFAIPLILEKINKARFIFCGIGEFEGEIDELLSLIKEKGLSDVFWYAEKLSGQDKYNYYLSSDIFVLPSYHENMPNSLLEAMAAGLPAVVSDVGAIPEIAKDGINGFLVKPGDIISLSEKIITLSSDAVLRKSMGKRNLEEAKEKYDMPIISDKIDKVYKELLSK